MLIPVILSGGNGSRLWPISHETCPKPFIRFNDSLSLLQTTYQRALNIPDITQIVTVTNSKYYYQSKIELNKLPALPKEKQFSFLLEPVSRNTAPAIVLSALFVQELINTDAILLILPVDHTISNQIKFNHSIKKALILAKQDLIVTFGIIPNKAEIGYGYIEYSDYDNINHSYQVKKFHEKPSLKKAEAFIEQGNYLWNSGIFCFSARTLIKNIEKYNPKLYIKTLDCWNRTKKNIFFQEKARKKLILDKKSFWLIEKISVDYALMEKSKHIVVIPTNFGWSDIGSWDVLNKLLKPDIKGNCIVGNAILKKSEGTTIYNQNKAKNRIIAAIGLNHLIIVDTPNALLVLNKEHTQDIKELVNELKSNHHEGEAYHQTVYRPWGYYTVLEHKKNYKLKQIVVNPGCSLSLQMHKHRSEHWVVIQGIATVRNNKAYFTLKKQESTFIPIGHKHCLSNLTLKKLVVIELQLGDYLGEDDIIRFSDNYKVSRYKEEVSTCL
ncbi:MAG: mannose-1-phosphate guanylyltransferase/mannose-6-phosphate isomerase [Rickettsia endosymbiont of Ixodes persulcatus]|nr:mannose-1-phosphate guanylyltransferase/mannose-6-phosphate isomerase [Rickettsia endosymbiont of Ixodes persulcatus]MCZ6914881.1 mannose-1-phosphate guanylyltransferase/mannose-6-phosphate isomerase [Rickettsia endosymbiont of Ixodes persulcatus]